MTPTKKTKKLTLKKPALEITKDHFYVGSMSSIVEQIQRETSEQRRRDSPAAYITYLEEKIVEMKVEVSELRKLNDNNREYIIYLEHQRQELMKEQGE